MTLKTDAKKGSKPEYFYFSFGPESVYAMFEVDVEAQVEAEAIYSYDK